MDDKEKISEQMLLCTLDGILSRLRHIEEYIETVLHAVCKSDDKKTQKAIQDYLVSNFRNRRGL